jgi:peptidoglycan/LPS O-acetylase OafA/YrhL
MTMPIESQAITDPRSPAPAPGQPRPALLGALTSIRFFAAFHVLLYHFFPDFREHGRSAWLIGSGYTGVSFFFILSGFILVYSHAREYLQGRGSAKRFYFARFARIYPVYLGALLITFALEWHLLFKPLHLLAVIADLLMVQSWSTKTAIFFLAPAWTLSCEAFFYCTFPFLILRLRPRSPARAAAGVFSLWLAGMIVPLWYLHHSFGWKLPLWYAERDSNLLNLVQFTPIFHLPEFLAGMVLGWIVVSFPPGRKLGLRLAIAGVILGLAGLWLSPHLPYILLHDGLLIPAYAALILGLSQDNILSRALSARPLILLGEASFALYLYHWFFSWYHPSPTLWSAAWKILVCIPLSILIHLGLERPARIVLLRWWNRRSERLA